MGFAVNTDGSTYSQNWYEVSTTHGYQVNPHFFVGAGVAFHFLPEYKDAVSMDGKPYAKRNSSTEIPLYVDVKWNILNMKFSPVIDVRLGHYVTNGSGAYASVGVGCRMSLKNHQALYGMIAASYAQFTYQELYMYKASKYNYRYSYRDTDNQEMNNLTFRVGYEF